MFYHSRYKQKYISRGYPPAPKLVKDQYIFRVFLLKASLNEQLKDYLLLKTLQDHSYFLTTNFAPFKLIF